MLTKKLVYITPHYPLLYYFCKRKIIFKLECKKFFFIWDELYGDPVACWPMSWQGTQLEVRILWHDKLSPWWAGIMTSWRCIEWCNKLAGQWVGVPVSWWHNQLVTWQAGCLMSWQHNKLVVRAMSGRMIWLCFEKAQWAGGVLVRWRHNQLVEWQAGYMISWQHNDELAVFGAVAMKWRSSNKKYNAMMYLILNEFSVCRRIGLYHTRYYDHTVHTGKKWVEWLQPKFTNLEKSLKWQRLHLITKN